MFLTHPQQFGQVAVDPYMQRIQNLLNSYVIPGLVNSGHMTIHEQPQIMSAIQNNGVINDVIQVLMQQVQQVDAYGNVTHAPVQRSDQDIASMLTQKLIQVVQMGRMRMQQQAAPQFGGSPMNMGMGMGMGGSIFMNANPGVHGAMANSSIFVNNGMGMQLPQSFNNEALSIYNDPKRDLSMASIHHPNVPQHEQNIPSGLDIYTSNEQTIAARPPRPALVTEVRSNPVSYVEHSIEPPIVTNAEYEASLATNSVQTAPEDMFNGVPAIHIDTPPECLLADTKKVDNSNNRAHLMNAFSSEGRTVCTHVDQYTTSNKHASNILVSHLDVLPAYRDWNDCKYDIYGSPHAPKDKDFPLFVNVFKFDKLHLVRAPYHDCVQAFTAMKEERKKVKTTGGEELTNFLSHIANMPNKQLALVIQEEFIKALNAQLCVRFTDGRSSIHADNMYDIPDLMRYTGYAHIPNSRTTLGLCIYGAINSVCGMGGEHYLNLTNPAHVRAIIGMGTTGIEYKGLSGVEIIHEIGASGGVIPEEINQQLRHFFICKTTSYMAHSKILPGRTALGKGIYTATEMNPMTSELDIVLRGILDKHNRETALPLYLDIDNAMDGSGTVQGMYSAGLSLRDHVTYSRVE